MNVNDFQRMHDNHDPITLVTCYDYTSAVLVEKSDIDCILVGDSLAMVMHGFDTTTSATMDIMVHHTAAVARGAKTKFIVGDMPFLSFRKSLTESMTNVERLVQAGAQAIKLEGADGQLELITHIVQSGVPVMGHLGLTPQSVNAFGGYKVQGRSDCAAEKIKQEAKALEQAGCFAIVLECVPNDLARDITADLHIPTIGIGAGPETSGQVLVWQDLLGLQSAIKPKFVKRYLDGEQLITNALNQYVQETKTHDFPDKQLHGYDY